MKESLCPCCSKMPYRDCCRRYHEGEAPENALALMRSRYAAYAMHQIDYIVETTHPDYPGRIANLNEWKKQIGHFSRKTQFEGLDILAFDDGENEATVTFRAHLKQNGRDATFTEKSTFTKVNGKWLYQSGKILRDHL